MLQSNENKDEMPNGLPENKNKRKQTNKTEDRESEMHMKIACENGKNNRAYRSFPSSI